MPQRVQACCHKRCASLARSQFEAEAALKQLACVRGCRKLTLNAPPTLTVEADAVGPAYCLCARAVVLPRAATGLNCQCVSFHVKKSSSTIFREVRLPAGRLPRACIVRLKSLEVRKKQLGLQPVIQMHAQRFEFSKEAVEACCLLCIWLRCNVGVMDKVKVKLGQRSIA